MEFRDLTGTAWRVQLTIGKAKRIKADLGVDLLAVADPRKSPLLALADDPEALCSVLWALVNPDWPDRVADETAFWNAVDDTVLEAATAALTEALLAFFRPSKRDVARAAISLQTKTEARLAERLATMATDDPSIDAAADRLVGTVKSGLQTLGS